MATAKPRVRESRSRSPSAAAALRIVSDTPIDDPRRDYFGFRAFSESLAYLIVDDETETPVTVAISAPWGGGKTSVARMAERQLKEWAHDSPAEREHLTCWFNAWYHDDAAHPGAALAAEVARTVNRHRRRARRIISPLPNAMLTPRERWRRRVGLAAAAIVAVGLALAIEPVRDVVSALPLADKSDAAKAGSFTTLAVLAIVLWPRMFSAAEHAARFVENPASEAASGSMHAVKEQLGVLIAQATRGMRLVIFIDDLERCRPDRALQVCEVATQLLGHEDVITVLIADMDAIAASAATAYADASDASLSADLGRRYLEKIVQIQLTLPPPAVEDLARLLRGEDPEAPR
jgi:KAP family P-loop domain